MGDAKIAVHAINFFKVLFKSSGARLEDQIETVREVEPFISPKMN